jgi:uncharacterized membrane protein
MRCTKILLRFRQWFRDPATTFVRLSLSFGLIFCFLVPPFQAPDEVTHFFRAYQVAEAQLIPQAQGNVGGGELPINLSKFANLWENLKFQPNNKASRTQFEASFQIDLQPQQRSFVGFVSTLYSPVPYLAQAIGIIPGRVFSAPPWLLFYSGRISNLVIGTAIAWAAIRLTPVFKSVFLLLGLMPMALFLRASLSADSFNNSIALLLVALVLQLAVGLKPEEQVSDRQIGFVAVVSLLLALCKPTYLPLIGLWLLIPPNRFGSQRRYWSSMAAIFIPSLLGWLSWSLVVRGLYPPPPNVFPSQQVQFVLSQPLKFLNILNRTFNDQLEQYLQEFVGTLGWLDTPLPGILRISYLIMLILVAVIETKPEIHLRRIQKQLIFAIFMVTGFLVCLSQYIIWTPVANPKIDGIQGRYFIAIAPLLLLLFYNHTIFSKVQPKRIHRFIVLFVLYVLVATVWKLYSRYYQ